MPIHQCGEIDGQLYIDMRLVEGIDEQIEARLAPFVWKAILDTRVLIAEDLGAAPTPLVLGQVEC